MSRRRRANPKIAGLLCAICALPASSFAHTEHKGMGGDPKAKRTDGYPACGVDHSDRRTCHGAQGQGLMDVVREDHDVLLYRPSDQYADVLHSRGVRCLANVWNVAKYEGADPDALDAR